MKAAKTSIAVFEFLDETHRNIQHQLTQLQTVVSAIERDELTADTREQARAVLDYFNTEARQHHLDEEKHIFPSLLDSSKPEIVQAAERLTQDHGWLEENWLQIEPLLDAATRGHQWFDPAELRHALDVFEALYIDHIQLEESLAYPEAKRRLVAYDAAGMGREMAQRRSQTKAQAPGKP